MRMPPFPTPTGSPLSLIIKILTCVVLSTTLYREVKEIRKEHREQAKSKERK